MSRTKIELLSPAANAEVACAAIDAGADAVYIGGPAFGARTKVANSMADVERVARYAHRYGGRCFLTLNTLVYESEMEEALRVAFEAYEAGVDALIIQDMGLIEAGLPPIELHASTQCHIASPQKARFLEQAGFSRLVLARELSIEEISRIAASVDCEIECFVHGSLCVSYSGQCYMGCYMNGRSGNRGECSQACRLPYDLLDGEGNVLQRKRFLLSMKDLKGEDHIRELIGAGVSCLKIEGRMKDAGYVKNVTAYYRKKIDAVLADASMGRIRPALASGGSEVKYGSMPAQGWERLSQGQSSMDFEPDLQKCFHRSYTAFNLGGQREKWVQEFSSKAVGEKIGCIKDLRALEQGYAGLALKIALARDFGLVPGDGLCYLDGQRVLQGGVLAKVEQRGREAWIRLPWSGKKDELPQVGGWVCRNRNLLFEKRLQDAVCERKIGIRIVFDAGKACFMAQDEHGFEASVAVDKALLAEAMQVQKAKESFERQMGKLGGTAYSLLTFRYVGSPVYFLPASALNGYRRALAEALDACRERAFSPVFSGKDGKTAGKGLDLESPVHLDDLSPLYRWNVANSYAARFYRKRGLEVPVSAFELLPEEDRRKPGRLLMVCKHCIRYQVGLCPNDAGSREKEKVQALYLQHGRERFALRFDCWNCRMEVWSV